MIHPICLYNVAILLQIAIETKNGWDYIIIDDPTAIENGCTACEEAEV